MLILYKQTCITTITGNISYYSKGGVLRRDCVTPPNAVLQRAARLDRLLRRFDEGSDRHAEAIWLRADEVNTDGAAAKVVFWQIDEKGTPWHFWEDKSRLTGVPKKSLRQKN